MKHIIFCLSVILSSGICHAESFDGCYQLLDTGVMYPAICLSGTNEEGIGGSGARMAIFHTNTDELSACLHSTGLQISDEEFVFEIDGRRELVLNNFTRTQKTLSGGAKVGSTQMQFVKLNDATQLIESARDNNCN